MKYFILCCVDQPKPGEWCELGEFLISEEADDVKKEFENAIVSGEYPYIATGSLSAEGIARMDVAYIGE